MSVPILIVPTHLDGMMDNGSAQNGIGEIFICITAPHPHSTAQPSPPPCTADLVYTMGNSELHLARIKYIHTRETGKKSV
jgi:hypothetical protein